MKRYLLLLSMILANNINIIGMKLQKTKTKNNLQTQFIRNQAIQKLKTDLEKHIEEYKCREELPIIIVTTTKNDQRS